MEKINLLANEISKLSPHEMGELSGVLNTRHSVHANIFRYRYGTVNDSDIKYDLHLVNTGPKKLLLVKTIKEIYGLGLKESKDIIDNLPNKISESISLDVAKQLKADLESVGAELTIIESN